MKNFFLFCLIIIYFNSDLKSQQKKSPLIYSFKEYVNHKNITPFDIEWIQIGPVINSARVESIQIDEKNPGTMYVAFGSGNLWKTVNNGISWKPIFNDVPSIGIGDIALAPSNSDILYVGTGESLKKARNFTMPGTGIYKSVDGGNTWHHKGLNDSWHIGEISINPKNPDIVFVSVLGHFWSKNKNRGIYRTLDGGSTWENVLHIDDKTGSNDIVISRSNPDIIYATMWENNPGISGYNSGIYKSEDNGDNWIKLEEGLPYGNKMGRSSVAVSYSNPEKAYVLIDNLAKSRANAAEVYRTENGGETWERTHKDELLIFPGIGWYFTDIYVSPDNDDEIYGLGVRAAYSNNGGKSFKNLKGVVKRLNPSQAKGLHLDHCELWINPKNSNHIAVGNDGGLFVSFDKGESWLHYNNLPTGEFYDIELDNKVPYNIYGGTQDDATVYGPADEWNNSFNEKWKYLWIDAWDGGDGCITRVDPNDNNTVYFSMQNGALRRKNMLSGISVSIKPKLPININDNLDYNFITPYFISNHDSNTLYHAGNYVFKSTDRGDSWKLISNNLINSSDKPSFSAGALAESKLEKGLLYYGSDRGSFWVSRNDGISWKERSEKIGNGYIRSIEPSKFNKSVVYMSMTGINYDDLNSYLYVSDNYGKNWKKLKGNLPNEPINFIREDENFEDILYAGLYRGLYVSLDRGKSWNILGKNLPMSSVSDMEVHKSTNDMIISTHGRGIYKFNLNPLHKYYLNQENISDELLFSDMEMVLPKFNDTHKEPLMDTYQKVPISFKLNSKKNYSLVIKENNEKLWSYESEGIKGINQIRWDLILDRVETNQPYFIHFNKFIKPGNYSLHLITDQKESKVNFSVYENL